MIDLLVKVSWTLQWHMHAPSMEELGPRNTKTFPTDSVAKGFNQEDDSEDFVNKVSPQGAPPLLEKDPMPSHEGSQISLKSEDRNI